MSTDLYTRIKLPAPERLGELEKEAPENLKKYFPAVRGGVKNIPGVAPETADREFESHPTLRALALNSDIFYAWIAMDWFSTKVGDVEPSTKELIGIAVASRTEAEGAEVCTPYHVGAAHFEGADNELIAIAESYDSRREELPEKIRTVVDFGVKAAFEPREITDSDIAGLRALGYSDEAVLELVSTALIVYDLVALNQIYALGA
jgi:alkylhydroperoxidase/carboxymuconolactone decarboxylase family protein YurZ